MKRVRKLHRSRHIPCATMCLTANTSVNSESLGFKAAYQSVRTIRLMMANHPDTKSVEVNSCLYEGKIGTYLSGPSHLQRFG